MNNGSDSHTELAARKSLFAMNRIRLEADYREICRWRQRIIAADRADIPHLEDCRRHRVMAHVDKLIEVAEHQTEVIHRILDLVGKYAIWGRGWGQMGPNKLYDLMCEEASYKISVTTGNTHSLLVGPQPAEPEEPAEESDDICPAHVRVGK